jgi:hypothetical protein
MKTIIKEIRLDKYAKMSPVTEADILHFSCSPKISLPQNEAPQIRQYVFSYFTKGKILNQYTETSREEACDTFVIMSCMKQCQIELFVSKNTNILQ